jgi:photosystem II stability/assembly factor-like uncharacterized protein
MRGSRRLALALIAALTGPSWLAAGTDLWTTSGPPAELTALAIDPGPAGTLYAATLAGIYRSPDHGETWILVNNSLAGDLSVFELKIDPADANTLYASRGGAAGGIFKSGDGGSAWIALNTGRSRPYYDGYKIVIDPTSNPSVVYAADAFPMAVLKSSDGGSTWTSNDDGFDQICGLTALAIDPIDPRRLYAGTCLGRVFRSNDAGLTWSRSSGDWAIRNFPVNVLLVDPQTDSNVYVGLSGGDQILRSRDYGETWSVSSDRPPTYGVNALTVDPRRPATLYAATSLPGSPGGLPPPPVGGISRSDDGGESWSQFNRGLPVYVNMHTLVIDSTGEFLHAGAFLQEGAFNYRINEIFRPVVKPASRRHGTVTRSGR